MLVQLEHNAERSPHNFPKAHHAQIAIDQQVFSCGLVFPCYDVPRVPKNFHTSAHCERTFRFLTGSICK